MNVSVNVLACIIYVCICRNYWCVWGHDSICINLLIYTKKFVDTIESPWTNMTILKSRFKKMAHKTIPTSVHVLTKQIVKLCHRHQITWVSKMDLTQKLKLQTSFLLFFNTLLLHNWLTILVWIEERTEWGPGIQRLFINLKACRKYLN